MKVRIKTAHGYLSFQPDGRLEYRAAAGAWEEIDIEGLELPAPVAPPGQPVQPDPLPVGPVPEPSAQDVAAVKDACLVAGISLSGACGAFEITKRVAWGLRTRGYGFLSKPSGNNCEKFATDVIVCPNRVDIVDILGDTGGENLPGWLLREDEVTADRFRDPVKP